MEIAKKVQASNQRIAAGFCALRDKNGNWICQTVAMDQNKKFTVGQDLQFQPCQAIQNNLAENDLLLPHENGFAMNIGKVKFENLQQAKTTSATIQNTQEQHQGKGR